MEFITDYTNYSKLDVGSNANRTMIEDHENCSILSFVPLKLKLVWDPYKTLKTFFVVRSFKTP